jgi:hypothetical protein
MVPILGGTGVGAIAWTGTSILPASTRNAKSFRFARVEEKPATSPKKHLTVRIMETLMEVGSSNQQ